MRSLRLGRSIVVSALAALAAAGCAPYQARPLTPTAFPQQLSQRGVPAGPQSQAQLLAMALANNAQAAQARAKYASALAAARLARRAPPATLTLTAEYSKEAGGSSPWLYGLGSDIPLDLGARRNARLTQADLTALQALYDYGETLWSVRADLARARAGMIRADQALPLARRALALRQERFDRLSRRVAAGEDARPAALIAQAELFTAQRRLSDAVAAGAQARAALAKVLGVAPAAVDSLVLAEATVRPDLAGLPAWRDQAALTRRDVLRAVADYDLAEANLRLEVARQYPAVSIGPGYTWERGVTKLPFNLGLTLPGYDLNRTAIAGAETRRAEAARALEATQAGVLAAVDQADAALAGARASETQAVQRDLPLAQRTAALTGGAVRAGELDRTDQLGADAAAVEAQLTVVETARLADLAVVDLEDALRRPFDPAETAILQAQTASGDAL